jgi:hypothetical protein
VKESEVKTSAEMGRKDARKIKVRITICAGCGLNHATLYKLKNAQGGDAFVCKACMLARQPVLVDAFRGSSRRDRRRWAREQKKKEGGGAK